MGSDTQMVIWKRKRGEKKNTREKEVIIKKNNAFGHLFKDAPFGLCHAGKKRRMTHAGGGSVGFGVCRVAAPPSSLCHLANAQHNIPAIAYNRNNSTSRPAEELCLTQTYPPLTRARHIGQSAILGSRRWSFYMKDRSRQWGRRAATGIFAPTTAVVSVV